MFHLFQNYLIFKVTCVFITVQLQDIIMDSMTQWSVFHSEIIIHYIRQLISITNNENNCDLRHLLFNKNYITLTFWRQTSRKDVERNWNPLMAAFWWNHFVWYQGTCDGQIVQIITFVQQSAVCRASTILLPLISPSFFLWKCLFYNHLLKTRVHDLKSFWVFWQL